MSDIILLFSTANQKIDHIIKGVISLYEMVFPNRIRGYYLVGSYADGSATPTSDIDLQIWFKEGFIDQEEKERARQLREPCWLMSPLDLDLMLVEEVIDQLSGIWNCFYRQYSRSFVSKYHQQAKNIFVIFNPNK